MLAFFFILYWNLRDNGIRNLSSSSSGKEMCLEAIMGPSNGDRYPGASGTVRVCFGGSLGSATGGTLEMKMEGLQESITGGVHIHTGYGCDTADQGGHYFNPVSGDPWFNAPDEDIAPDGAGYTNDEDGEAESEFEFDQGYGYADTVGRVIVVHDQVKPVGDYARVACGVLMAV